MRQEGYLPVDPAALLSIGLVGAGILLLRGQQPTQEGAAESGVIPRERSPLGALTLAVAFLTAGTMILLGNLGIGEVYIAHIAAACLAVIACGLVVGAWWGRARVLIAVGVLLVPIVVVSGFMHLPLRGSVGDTWVNTRLIDEVPEDQEILIGTLNMNLADLRDFEGTRELDVTVVAGRATIFVPAAIGLTIEGHIEFGNANVGHGRQEGDDLDLYAEVAGKPGAGHLTIDFRGGVAALYVERITQRDLHGPLRPPPGEDQPRRSPGGEGRSGEDDGRERRTRRAQT